MQALNLPQPGDAEIAHSEQLSLRVRQKIRESSGWIPFSQYMQMALYEPGLGYYSAGLQKFGEKGDFITSPELGSLFAKSLARPVAKCIEEIPECHLIEFGAGSGKLAGDLLLALQQAEKLPEAYWIIELSADLQQRQREYLSSLPTDLFDRVKWLNELPEQKINAVVVANEVLDAMPVKRFCQYQNSLSELGVGLESEELVLQYQSANHELSQAIEKSGLELMRDAAQEKPYCSEINTHIYPWLNALSQSLNKMAVYIIDYGYPRAEYYSAERSEGTFMGYYQHRAIDTPLWYPGLQDLTAFVDFTALAEAALELGLDVDGFTSQGNFLVNCGLADIVESTHCATEIEKLQLIQQMKTISLPGEMGERFKVLGISRDLKNNIAGFEMRDQRYRL